MFNASFCVVARQIVVSFSGDLPKEVVRNMLWYYNEAVENYLYLVLHFQCYKFYRVIKINLFFKVRSPWNMFQKNSVVIQFFPTRIIETFWWHLLCLISINLSFRQKQMTVEFFLNSSSSQFPILWILNSRKKSDGYSENVYFTKLS